MSYEWFANTFPLKFCMDYLSGSTYERVTNTPATVVGTPFMRPGGGYVAQDVGSYLSYASNANFNITDTTRPFTLVASTMTLRPNNVGCGIIVKGGTGWGLTRYSGSAVRFSIGSGGDYLLASIGVNPNTYLYGNGKQILVVSYDGGLRVAGVRCRLNGALQGQSVAFDTLTARDASNVSALSLNISANCRMEYHTVAMIDKEVTSQEAAAIYEHLRTERPARIHPRRKFSIPMALRTPTRELADGYIYAAAGGMSNGQWPDLISGARPAARVGPIDVAKSGPYCEHPVNYGTAIAASLALPAGDTDIFNTNDWTFSCWLMVPAASATVRKIVQLDGVNHYIALDAAEKIVVSSVNGAGAQVTTTSTAALVTGKWYHVLVSRQMTGLDARTRILLDGTVDTDSTSVGIGVTLPVSGTPWLAAGGMHLDAVRYRKNVITSDADARAECLQGGKRVLFDGRLCTKGCCPVTPVAISGAMNAAPGAPWMIASGAYKVLEDAPSASRVGKRRIQVSTIGTMYSSDLDAFGSWYFEMNKVVAGSTLTVAFVSNIPDATSASVGYRVDITSLEAIALIRNTGGATLTRFTSAAGYVANGVPYAFWVSRTAAEFTVWIKGGAFAVWTLVSTVGGTGTNPVAEATYNTSRYMALRTGGAGAGDEFGGVVHYQTAMTPTEAIALGILES